MSNLAITLVIAWNRKVALVPTILMKSLKRASSLRFDQPLEAPLAESNVIFMIDCWKYGAADWDHNNRGVITNITIAANTTGVNTGNTLIVTSA